MEEEDEVKDVRMEKVEKMIVATEDDEHKEARSEKVKAAIQAIQAETLAEALAQERAHSTT